MPDFTIKNLMEIEDSAAGRGPEIEARIGRKHLDSEHLGASHRMSCAHSRPARKASSCSQSGPTGPTAATAS